MSEANLSMAPRLAKADRKRGLAAVAVALGFCGKGLAAGDTETDAEKRVEEQRFEPPRRKDAKRCGRGVILMERSD